MQQEEKYCIRTYERGDENSLVRLFNKQYENYGGFVKRTVEYLFWSCMERPDVEKEGVLVVVDGNDTVVGYAVVGKSGNMWEFSYDPERNGEEIVSLLFESSKQYLRKNGVEAPLYSNLNIMS